MIDIRQDHPNAEKGDHMSTLVGTIPVHVTQSTYTGPGSRWHRVSHLSHEQFCHRVRDLAVARILDHETRDRLLSAKMVYGAGSGAYRGVCHYNAWHNGAPQAFIEIAATGEESTTQLAGTTIHETAHVLAGWDAGHGAQWKAACFRLGLKDAMASGQHYDPEAFVPELWHAIHALGEPGDGKPSFVSGGAGLKVAPGTKIAGRACPMGRGTRGGTSYGKGSGRLRLWECACARPVKVRVASDDFRATCDRCHSPFTRQGV